MPAPTTMASVFCRGTRLRFPMTSSTSCWPLKSAISVASPAASAAVSAAAAASASTPWISPWISPSCAGRVWAYKRRCGMRSGARLHELRRSCSGTGSAARAGYAVQRWLSNRVSRKPDDILRQRNVLGDGKIVRFLVKCTQAWDTRACTCTCICTRHASVHIHCTCTCEHCAFSPRAE